MALQVLEGILEVAHANRTVVVEISDEVNAVLALLEYEGRASAVATGIQ
jgi:hypothetical protein